MLDIRLTPAPLDILSTITWVMTPQSGGFNLFAGTVRSSTMGKKVLRLEFEAYDEMAISEIKKIAEAILNRWPVHRLAIHHRTGVLHIGEVPVLIAVSAAHRDASFEACRYAIDTLKQTVPIWKKEIFEDGAIWVAAHP